MNIQNAINIASAGVVALSLSLSPFAVSLRPDPPSLSPFVQGEDGVLMYPSRLPSCDNEDGTSTHNGKSVPACYFDSGPTGTSFVVIRTHRSM